MSFATKRPEYIQQSADARAQARIEKQADKLMRTDWELYNSIFWTGYQSVQWRKRIKNLQLVEEPELVRQNPYKRAKAKVFERGAIRAYRVLQS